MLSSRSQIFFSLKPATGEAGSCVGSAWRRVLAVGVWRLAGIGHWSDAAGAALGHLAVVAGICRKDWARWLCLAAVFLRAVPSRSLPVGLRSEEESVCDAQVRQGEQEAEAGRLELQDVHRPGPDPRGLWWGAGGRGAPERSVGCSCGVRGQGARRVSRLPRRGASGRRIGGGSFDVACVLREVLRQVHPKLTISKRSVQILNSLVQDSFEKISEEAQRLVKRNKRQTLTSREVQTAIRLVFPGELAKHAVSEGTKAVTKFSNA